MKKYQIKIISSGAKHLSLVKSLRLLADIGLENAKQLSDFLRDSSPCILVAGVDGEVADHAAELLREAGAEVIIEESSIEVPMLLCPAANQRYRWSWIGGPTQA
jgi:ribosomal protein L7/L12